MRRLTKTIAAMLVAVGGGALLYALDRGPREPEVEHPEPWDRGVVAIVEAAAAEDANGWSADLLCRHPLLDGGRADFTCDTAPADADAEYLACCAAERMTYSVPYSPTGASPATHYGTSTRATGSYSHGMLVKLQADAQQHGRQRGWAAVTEHPCQGSDAGCASLPVPLVADLDALAAGLGLVRVTQDADGGL